MINALKNILQDFGLEYFKKYYGVYRGFVHSVEDPKNLGRVQLNIPSIYEKPYKYWSYPMSQLTAGKNGTHFLPKKGDLVWVQFENGEPRFPLWSFGVRGETLGYAIEDVALKVDAVEVVISPSNSQIDIKVGDNTTFTLNTTTGELKAPVVNLAAGSNPATKGNETAQVLSSLIDALVGLSTVTPAGAGVLNPSTITQLNLIKSQINTILSNQVFLS